MEIINYQSAEIIPSVDLSQLEDILNKFIDDQDVKASSKSAYKRALNQFFKWVIKKGVPFPLITRVEILSYKEDLFATGMSGLTVSSYLTSVRKFYEWAESKGYCLNVAKGVKSPKRKQQFRKQPLTTDQCKSLLAHFQQTSSARDFAIINLLLRTGLRTIEVIRANIEDIKFKGGKRVLMVHGKGRDEKDSFVILTDKAFSPIQDYIQTRTKVKAGEPLFISISNNSKGDRLTTRTVSKIAKEGLKSIGLNSRSLTAHSLRHTAAVSILRAGGSLEETQGVLRHSNISTTQIYTATLEEEIRLQKATEELIDNLY